MKFRDFVFFVVYGKFFKVLNLYSVVAYLIKVV